MLLAQLSNAIGVSGDENRVREIILDAIRHRIDEYRVDTMGNLIACKRSTARPARRGFKVLVAAHMDEVGLLITHADSDGRLRFARVGGIDNRVLPSQVFNIGPNRVPGVIGWKPVHRSTPSEREHVINSDDLTLDIGARSKEEATGAVKIGDYAAFATEFSRVGDNCVRGKSLDDRTGCAILIELLEQDYPFDFYAVFTVQEEIGTRGARVAGHIVRPDVVLVLESAACDDSPREEDHSPTARLGHGPALTIADRGAISDKRLVKLFMTTSREKNIPLQIKQPMIGGTDAGRLSLAGEGAPSIALAVPTRYIHSPISLLSLTDYAQTVRLMQEALPHLTSALASRRD